ncbi:MAG: hypothetical protein HY661_08430 [Betaproteobacteria bacterium]|nr:hypothetical protein [Betaproteobacteria bacterium]
MSARRAFLGALILVSAAVSPAADSADLGRLFFTPQQRGDMDRRRLTNEQERAVVTIESVLTVDGHVSRSAGPATTWINGVPQEGVRPGRDPAQVVIQPTEAEPQVSVKVGQTLDRTRGEVREGFGSGEVRVGGAARKAR